MKQARKILLLPPDLRDQIAAGEVVERPASVLKELIENSLDAGADEIIIQIEDGGQSLLSVKDNGYGILADELELAVTSHATSKVHSFAELLKVSSYGFRGEALPSVASIASLKVSSQPERNGQKHEASFIEILHGRIVGTGPAAIPCGTMVEVRDLFANVPARLKFLKTNATELKRCQEVVMRMALAHLHVSFALYAGAREIYSFTRNESLQKRLEQIWPPQIVTEMLPFALEKNGMKVSGLTGGTQAAQAKADRMLFYVNGRAINNRMLISAVREAYKGRLLSREYPQVVLFLELDPEEVDVNVHPAKTEVRFRDERSVFSLTMRAVAEALNSRNTDFSDSLEYSGGETFAPAQKAHDMFITFPELENTAKSAANLTPYTVATDTVAKREPGFWGSADSHDIIKAHTPDPLEELSAEVVSGYHHVPSLAEPATSYTSDSQHQADSVNLYINEASTNMSPGSLNGLATTGEDANTNGAGIAEMANRMNLSEQVGQAEQTATPAHFATPQMPSTWHRPTVLASGLVYLGQVVDTYLIFKQDNNLILLDQHAVHERILMHRFTAEAKQGACQLLALPLDMQLHPTEAESLEKAWDDLAKLGFSLVNYGGKSLQVNGIPPLLTRSEAKEFLRDALAEKGQGMHKLLAMMSCKGAIKAGQKLTDDEALALVQQWLSVPEKEYCPHGRPTIIRLSSTELEKMFKRRN